MYNIIIIMMTYLYYIKILTIFAGIISLFYFIYKRYFKFIVSLFNRYILKKGNKIESIKSKKINKKVENLKDLYGIKSTDKTNIYLKYIISKPSYINVNNIDDLNLNIQHLSKDNNSKKIIETYIYNKRIFVDLFLIDNKLCINNLKDFYDFHKIYSLKKINKKYNILFKFYCTKNKQNEYLYVCVDNNCLIKIKKYEEYDKICELIESGKNIFLIHENYKKYFISYGGYIESKLEQDDIKKTFFTNGKIYNKNYEILNKFKNVKIFLYVCTELLINQ